MAKKANRHLPALTADELAAQFAAGGAAREQAVAWYAGVVARAEEGDRDALRQALAIAEAIPSLLAASGLQRHAEDAYLDPLAGTERLLTRHVLRQEIEALRGALAGSNPSPMEALLVDRIVLCWLDCQHAEATLAGKLGQSLPITQADCHHCRAERAQRRHLEAIKTLATVGRLLTPAIQLNIGEKQVNIAGSGVPAPIPRRS